MTNIAYVICAHFIGDCGLQSYEMGRNKRVVPSVMFAHCITWTACICLAYLYLGVFMWWKPIILMLSHWMLDLPPRTRWWFPIVDQTMHIATIIMLLYF